MPNILVHIPHGAFPGGARDALVRRINEAAAEAEQMPADPRQRALCWVVVHEAAPGAWTCGGADPTARLLPCIAQVNVPAGVLDEAARARYIAAMHDAFKHSMLEGDKRMLATSVMLNDVADGAWGAGGALWKLPDFARAAGYAHLQHLCAQEVSP